MKTILQILFILLITISTTYANRHTKKIVVKKIENLWKEERKISSIENNKKNVQKINKNLKKINKTNILDKNTVKPYYIDYRKTAIVETL